MPRTKILEQDYRQPLSQRIKQLCAEHDALTQDELAGRMRELGYPWTQAIVAAVFSADRHVSLGELIGLAAVFNVALADLFADPREEIGSTAGPEVELGGTARLPLGAILSLLRGEVAADWHQKHLRGQEPLPLEAFADHDKIIETLYADSARKKATPHQLAVAAGGQLELTIARNLADAGILSAPDSSVVTAAAFARWGHSATAERNKQSEGGRSPQHIGRKISATLTRDIELARRKTAKGKQSKKTKREIETDFKEEVLASSVDEAAAMTRAKTARKGKTA